MTTRGWNLVLGATWAGLGTVTLLLGLGSFGLTGPDEPRYAAIAFGMLARHGFVSPILWGSPWLEKPVLYYWLAALAGALGHASDAYARLPSAVLGLAMCAGLGWFLTRTHSARAGWLAAFLGVSSAFVIAFGRAATTDMTLTAPLALGLMAWYVGWRESRVGWWYLAAALFALATLAKGPIGLALPVIVVAAFTATLRQPAMLRRSLRPGLMAEFVAIAAPWYIAVQRANPAFARVFFLQHNLERFATNRFEHPQAWWYYGPVLLLAVFPWTGWLGLPLAAAVRRLRRRDWDFSTRALPLFLGLWLLAPVVLFSLSRSKLPGYILPAVPAALGLIAVYAAEAWERLPRWPLVISAGLAGIIPVGLRLAPVVLASAHLRPHWGIVAQDLATWELGIATGVALLALVVRRRPQWVAFATCALVAGALVVMTMPAMAARLDDALSARPLARLLQQQSGGTPIVVYSLNRNTQYGVQFYLGRELATWQPGDTDAIVLVDREAVRTFLAHDAGVRQVASLGDLKAATPWVAIRVKP